MFSDIYNSLKQGFNQSWFRFIFQFTDLAKLLSKPTEPAPWHFFSTYLSSWWFTRWWFYFCIKQDNLAHVFDTILELLEILKESQIFIEDNCKLIASNPNPYYLQCALEPLVKYKILTQDTFTLVENQRPVISGYNLAFVLINLSNELPFIKENFHLLASCNDPLSMASVLRSLNRASISTQDKLVKMAAHTNLKQLADDLDCLKKAGLLTESNFNKLINLNYAAVISKKNLWTSLLAQSTTQVEFEKCLTFARNADLIAQIKSQELSVQVGGGPIFAFNRTQNTHDASLHLDYDHSFKP